MLRLMVTSQSYRQSSQTRPELVTRDPNNTLLARQTRLRLSAEAVRDNALAVSGLLSRTIGGPSVKPPQPASVSKEGFRNRWETSPGADRYRRGTLHLYPAHFPLRAVCHVRSARLQPQLHAPRTIEHAAAGVQSPE